MISRIGLNVLLPILLSITAKSLAQVEGTMPFMTSLPQVTYYNPAFKPAYKFSVGLPGSSIFAQYGNNGFTYNDFISKQGNLLVADLNKLYNAMGDQNYINTNAQVDLFRMSLKVNPRLYITLNATAKGYNRLLVPREITGIFANGTEPYINNKATFSPKAEATEYLEYGLGAAYTINKKLTVGLKLKILRGLINATTEHAVYNLSLSDTYAITATGDADLRTSGIHNFNQPNYSLENNWKDYVGSSNSGLAFDVGGTYQVNDKLMIGLSLIDIGSITWKNDTYGYQHDPAKATYTWSGINIQDLLNGNSNYTNSLTDSLSKKFKFTEGVIGAYTTSLPGKIYLSGTYRLRQSVHISALAFAEIFRGRFLPGFSTSVNKEFGRRLSASISYTLSNNSFNNLGGGLSLNLPPIQIYIVSDNLLTLGFGALRKDLNSVANNAHSINVRTGINFVFGWDKTPEKQPYSKAIKSKR